jgi:hypothetical protein
MAAELKGAPMPGHIVFIIRTAGSLAAILVMLYSYTHATGV